MQFQKLTSKRHITTAEVPGQIETWRLGLLMPTQSRGHGTRLVYIIRDTSTDMDTKKTVIQLMIDEKKSTDKILVGTYKIPDDAPLEFYLVKIFISDKVESSLFVIFIKP